MSNQKPERLTIRKAMAKDALAVRALDRMQIGDSSRRRFLVDAIRRRACYVATVQGRVVAAAVMDRSFFEQSFVSLLVVHPEWRRRGVGSALMRRLETSCGTEKLFTSTNESNLPMQRLCESLGYVRSGRVDNLDEGDPELIYFKQLCANRAGRRGRALVAFSAQLEEGDTPPRIL